jgi:hypothetical protein
MTKAPRVTLPDAWKRFVRRYGQDMAYWYQPKGLAITVDGVVNRLRILKEFEGAAIWRDCQADYIRRLREEGISDASATWDEGGAPLARMLKQVLTVLGLAWIDPSDRVEITIAGDSVLQSSSPEVILARQALRYQFWNPSVSSRDHQAIKLHPVPFLVRLLQAVDGSITALEYNLFVGKARSINSVDEVATLIDEFRLLSTAEQNEVARQCDNYRIGGLGRSSIYNSIKLDRSYAYKMWCLSSMIHAEGTSLKLTAGSLRGENRAYLDEYAGTGSYIAFTTEKEFLAWMGDPEKLPNKETALDIYMQRGDLEAATLVKKSLGASKSEITSFKRMMIDEKTLEDNIEANFEAFSRQVKRPLELIDRQYATTVGPIDLLARDKRTGDYVVIELKKGRSADRVFGQISRYMGWVRKNLAEGQQAHGIIVASRIDDKLRAARDAHETPIQLVEFESKMAVKVV